MILYFTDLFNKPMYSLFNKIMCWVFVELQSDTAHEGIIQDVLQSTNKNHIFQDLWKRYKKDFIKILILYKEITDIII